MNNIINEMIKQYDDIQHPKMVLKEVIQEFVLCALSHTDFFNHATFYGGTALRLFYGLDRFSEDLDFSLKEENENFVLENYFGRIIDELKVYGIEVSIDAKEKAKESNIQSAFIKGNTREHIIRFELDKSILENTNSQELIKIKLEIDIHPPKGANFETKYRLLPSPYEISIYDNASLFAGKIHAILCRGWKDRVKGRDLYDYLFYVARKTPINLSHLDSRLIDSNFKTCDNVLSINLLKEYLVARFNQINFNEAKNDVSPFLKNPNDLNIWSKDFFISTIQDII